LGVFGYELIKDKSLKAKSLKSNSFKSYLDEAFGFIDICGANLYRSLKPLKALNSKSFLDEAFGFIDICGAKPRIFSQRQSQKLLTLRREAAHVVQLTFLPESEGLGPELIYGRRSLPSKKDLKI
jgi:hypothetical protein